MANTYSQIFIQTVFASSLVRDIKAGFSKFITDKGWVKKFNWQFGFGAFSYSKREVKHVINYILNQEEHHKTTSFKNEYVGLLKEFDIGYSDKYNFDWIENENSKLQ